MELLDTVLSMKSSGADIVGLVYFCKTPQNINIISRFIITRVTHTLSVYKALRDTASAKHIL